MLQFFHSIYSRAIKEKTLFNNTVLSLGSKAISMLLFLLTDILIARLLTILEYGEWSYYYSMISIFFWIAWFGLNTSARVFIAGSEGDISLQNKYIRSSFHLRSLISVFFLVFFLLAAGPMANVMGYPNKYPHLYILLLFGAAHIFLNSFAEYLKDIYIGLVDFRAIFILALTEFGGYLLFGVGLLLFHTNLYWLEIGYLIALLMVAAIGLLFLRRRVTVRTLFTWDKHALSYYKELMGYAIPILIISIGAGILLEMDTIMIGVFHSPEQVSIYSVAKKLLTKAMHVNFAVCSSTMTAFAILTPENLALKRKLFNKIMGINAVITFGISLAFFTIGPFAIKVFYGEEYMLSKTVLWFLIPYYCFQGISVFMATLMDYQKRAKTRGLFYTIMILFNLVFNVLLIPRYGAAGAAIGTSVSMIPYFCLLFISTLRIFRPKNNPDNSTPA